MTDKTSSLPLPGGTQTKHTAYYGRLSVAIFILVFWALRGTITDASISSKRWTANETLYDSVKCPKQPDALYPTLEWSMTAEEKSRSIELLSQAIQIQTVSFDDNGDPEDDPRWSTFIDFQAWLRKAFPLIHSRGNVEYINTLGIVVTLQGTNPTLKPLLLMCHYDVVPVPQSTADRWKHSPFSGFNDGTHIWGRGSADQKTLLVAQWEAITHLLEKGFIPRRTILLTHGFDEEVDFARRGQGRIAPFLEERYGTDSLLMVVDEGMDLEADMWGAPFATPAMGEKGYMDIEITVGTAGGHSSVPPIHSGIGVMAQAISGLEDNPFPIKLGPASPVLTGLFCASEHAPSFPRKYTRLLEKGPLSWQTLAEQLASESRQYSALLGTTAAVDVIYGGVKVNALPELVTAHVNFRIDFAETVKSTQDHISSILSRVATNNALHFSSFRWNLSEGLNGKYIRVETMGVTVEPAPRTPHIGGVWELFAGTVKSSLRGYASDNLIVSPYAMTGNTDCRNYYNLSRNIYRFTGAPPGTTFALHTVNEKSTVEGHFAIIGWIHALVQNADAYRGEECIACLSLSTPDTLCEIWARRR